MEEEEEEEEEEDEWKTRLEEEVMETLEPSFCWLPPPFIYPVKFPECVALRWQYM